jgi:maltose phosphorylase
MKPYLSVDPWRIVETGWNPADVRRSESIFSIGNGRFGQRANFEETYSGDHLPGSYVAGVYYPDKTRVGWWKNGYPEYFAKVLNAPNWIGINIEVNGENLDLATCKSVSNFRRELNMKEGWYQRSFQAVLQNDVAISVDVTRFLSLDIDELGAIKYQVTPTNTDAKVVFKPYLDAGIENEDTNWEEKFWETLEIKNEENNN